ncbi:MAG TPA: PilN domain-containing protein [Stellaceae bacterium]|nr:PilN domain-containing protein [Stellaceae bacterium]
MTLAAHNDAKRAWGAAGRALSWWVGELRGVWDDLARRFELGTRAAIVIEAGERYWIVRQRQRVLGQIDRTGSDPAETRRTLTRLAQGPSLTIEIPQERVLTRRISLPASAEGQVDRILRFEIARLFPFPAERVHFCHRVTGKGGLANDGGAIEVEVVAVAREVVADICASLTEAGLTPNAICIGGGTGTAPLYLPGAAIGRPGPAFTGTTRTLLVTLGVLVVAALASPILHDRMRLAAADHEIATLKPAVQTALDARDRQRREAAETASPLRLRAARPPLVAVLDELTKVVPDGAWFTSLTVSGREVVIDGLSPSAAATALALEQSHDFTNVVFRSPIARDVQTGLERFQITVAIAEPKP